MKKSNLFIGSILLFLFLVVAVAPTQAASSTIVLTNPPPNGVLELAVGESYTFVVDVTSDEEFIWARALRDIQFPGRGIYFNDSDIVQHDTSATLYMTVTGKNPTDDLPNGMNQASVVVGVRYQGGELVYEYFDFGVVVTP